MVDSALSNRRATAWHEAGHAVVALAVGRTIQRVSIVPGNLQGGGVRLGACQMKKGRSKPSKEVLEDDVLILFAGMVAEARLTGTYCPQGANSDLRMIRRLLQNRGGSERQLDRLERRLLDKTEHLLNEDQNIKAVELIVAELLEKETISGRSAQHLFNMATATK